MDAPRKGEIYEKNGLRREVVMLDRRSDWPNDIDVLWKRPGSEPDRGWESAVWLSPGASGQEEPAVCGHNA